MLIDLPTGKLTNLINAPHGASFGYSDEVLAAWSPRGDGLLLTSTFLPLTGVTAGELEQRKNECQAAVVDVKTRGIQCLRFSKYHRDDEHFSADQLFLMDARYEQDGRAVVLRLRGPRTSGLSVVEHYRSDRGTWRKTGGTVSKAGTDGIADAGTDSAATRTLAVTIAQSLSSPPVLQAHDPVSGRTKVVWNPNPQLAGKQMGSASVYRWKDTTGHEWTGGLVLPVGYEKGKRYPLVIQTYVFYPQQFLADGMDTTAEAALPLASAGIAVLQIEKRFDLAVTDQEAAIQEPGFEAAINSLADAGIVDPTRVGIIGFSRGCYYVEKVLIDRPGLFAAATTADGADQSYVSHMIWQGSPIAMQDDSIYGVAPQGEGLRVWMEKAPGFNLHKVRTPVRIESIGAASVIQEAELYGALREQEKTR